MTMGFMWFTLILYCVCQIRLHFVHVCMHISCMLFFDVFCVCMCVYVSVFVSVCWLAFFFFVCWFVCSVQFGYWFGFVCLLVWFGLFICLDCLLVAWFCCCSCCSRYCWWFPFFRFHMSGTFEDTWTMALEALDTCNSMWNRKSLIFPCRPDDLWVFSSLPQRSLTQWMFWLE